MKRIIDGVAYNTDTSTQLARSEYEALYNNEPYECEGTLFQTRGGTFFVREKVNLGRNEDQEFSIKNRFRALSAEEAQTWIMTGDVEIFHNPFGEPPEAASEAEASATIYVRVPISLKKRLELAAIGDKLSGNSWAIRCIEKCLFPNQSIRNDIGFIWSLAKDIELGVNDNLDAKVVAAIAGAIADIVEANWNDLGFKESERFDQDLSDLAVSGDYCNRTSPLMQV